MYIQGDVFPWLGDTAVEDLFGISVEGPELIDDDAGQDVKL